MSDMLVKLYDLPDLDPLIKKQEQAGIAVRRAMVPEKHLVVDFVGKHFDSGWAAQCEVTFSSHPVTSFIAVKDDRVIGFASYDGTFRDFFGPTGGYLLSYIPAVLLISLIAGNIPRPPIRETAALICGTTCIYLTGMLWLKWISGMQWETALSVGVLPFLPGDTLKIVAALLVSRRFGERIERFCAYEEPR